MLSFIKVLFSERKIVSYDTPKELLYTEDHEWIKIEGEFATIGITDYAQSSLGDIVFVELPQIGDKLAPKDSFGVVESIKSVSDLYAPLGGEVVEINERLESEPEICNESPYVTWVIKIKLQKTVAEKSGLLNADQYAAFCNSLD